MSFTSICQQKQEMKVTPQPIKKESTTPQGKPGTASKKPVGTPKEEGIKKESVTGSVKKETERNGQAGKKTDTKAATGSGSKSPAAGAAKTADKKQAGDNGRPRRGPRPPKSAQRYPQGRGGSIQGGRGGSIQGGRAGSIQGGRGGSAVGRGRGTNGRPGFASQRRVGKWEQGTPRAGMRGNQMHQQQQRSSFGVRTQKRQGLWEQALERRQEQRTGYVLLL